MLAADFCHTVRLAHASLSHEPVTYGSSPEVSTTAFRAQPPDLRLTPLMDMDFAIIRSLVRRSRLVSGFCSSARAFARRFFQTHNGALALCYPSPPSGWGEDFHSRAAVHARHTSNCAAVADASSDLHGYHAARGRPGGFCFLFVALDSHDLPTRLRPGREIRE